MKTVSEIAKKTGVSVRTLHHYDAIGLLKPTAITEAGYRLYDDAALENLYLILLFREIGFSLKDIREILDAPDFDRNRILEQQIALLVKKQAHLQALIHLTRGVKLMGVNYLNMDTMNLKKLNDYEQQAKALYGKTDAYKEYQQKAKGRSKEQNHQLGEAVMDLFVKLGELKHLPADSEAVQAWVAELQAYFTEHFYTCTPQILLSLSEMYAGGGSMTENIDAAGGKGTGAFAREAIAIYCKDKG